MVGWFPCAFAEFICKDIPFQSIIDCVLVCSKFLKIIKRNLNQELQGYLQGYAFGFAIFKYIYNIYRHIYGPCILFSPAP